MKGTWRLLVVTALSGTSCTGAEPAPTAAGMGEMPGGGPVSGGGVATSGGSDDSGGAAASGGASTDGSSVKSGGRIGDGAVRTGSGAAMTDAPAGDSGSDGMPAGSGNSTVTILPGTIWSDTQGRVIQAHGAGIIQVAGTYYWLGEDRTNGGAFQNVSCYSSIDLKTWSFVKNVLTRQLTGDLGPNRVVERPHVLYNSATSQYVMYMHIDGSNYSERKAGVATSGSVCGDYVYRGSFRPLGHDSLDDNLFQDGTAAYFLSEDRTNAKLQIYLLSADYLTVSSLVATVAQYEAPAVAKVNGMYFLFGSHLSGWATNDNQYTTASSMAGPWATWKSFAPAGSNTCDSQATSIVAVNGTSGTTYVFLGDRWNPSNLGSSRYIWQPLTISGAAVSMGCAPSWKIDVATGIWSP
ncbi:MAG: family 43 glycosylhydrolase [Myxococcota bacterium]|nr:family 43 glycosylhydrolase [Myxococcota bacterium]